MILRHGAVIAGAGLFAPPDWLKGAHVVYRIYDAAGRLLYVGYSGNVPGRAEMHKRESPWWSHCASWTITARYRTQAEARAAETRAIKDEHPLENKIHNGAFYRVNGGMPSWATPVPVTGAA